LVSCAFFSSNEGGTDVSEEVVYAEDPGGVSSEPGI
jgi:hypothetical protein